MSPNKAVLFASDAPLPKKVREIIHSNGYQIFTAKDAQHCLKIAQRKSVRVILFEMRFLLENINGSMPAMPANAYKAALVSSGQLPLVLPYLHKGQLQDHLLTPLKKVQVQCMLEKAAHYLREVESFDKTGLEDIVERKLSRVLHQLDFEQVEGLHELIMPRLERPFLRMILEKTRGNQLRAAKALGINRNTLRRKLDSLQLDPR